MFTSDERTFRWFECTGTTSSNDEAINSSSFVPCGEREILYGNVKNEGSASQKDVLLFGHIFDQGTAIYNSKLLFVMARKEFKMLEYSFHPRTQEEDNALNGNMTEEECFQTRAYICELLNYVRVFLMSVPLEMKPLMDRVKNIVMPGLVSFRNDLPILSSLSPVSLLNFLQKGAGGFYHLFHLNLDVRWYYISILLVIKNHADSASKFLASGVGFIAEARNVGETGLLEGQIQSLVTELIFVALARFEKASSNDLHQETPFVCECMKELWLMLQILCDYIADKGGGKSFWAQVNSLLDRVQSTSSSLGNDETTNHISEEGGEKEKLVCSNPVSFNLWMILHLSHLYGYSDNGHFLGRKSKRVKNNFSQLEKILSDGINCNAQNGNESQMERRMRQYICMTSEICLGRWWEPLRAEPVMIFWEYFHRKLNSSLIIRGTSPAVLPMMSKTAVGILEQIRKSLSQEERTECEPDSFFMFMKFLGIHLLHCREEEGSLEENESGVFRQWQQIRGRIYSKLGPAKLKGLSHCGLYRFVSLFLMLSITADVKEVGKKMLSMLASLNSWDPSGHDFPKRELVWKAYICLIYLHIEREIDIAAVAAPLMSEVEAASSELAVLSKSNSSFMSVDHWKTDSNNLEGLRRLLSIFTEGLNEIMEMSPKMCLSEHILIGSWLPQWFKLCSISSARRLMDSLLSIVDKLRKLRQGITQRSDNLSELWGDSEDIDMFCDENDANPMKKHWDKMEAALTDYVLPSIREHCLGANPAFQAADLAASFTLSSFGGDGKHFVQLFTFFAASDVVHHRISRRYLCQIIPYKKFMNAISMKMTNHEDVIVQAWIRSSLLSVEESAIVELEELASHVMKLRSVSHLLSSEVSSSNCSPTEIKSLEQFLRAIGEKYESLQTLMERAAFREKCSIFFIKLDKIIGPYIRSPSSEEIIKSIYHCCGLMVQHCRNIIYMKGKADCILSSILTRLLLPSHIYNPDVNLHKHILGGIKRSINLYICGLAQLSPASDPFIKRCLRDIITHYIPRLYEKSSGNVSFSHTQTIHPLLVSFEKSNYQNEIIQNTVIEILNSMIQVARGKQIHVHASKAIRITLQIWEITRRKVRVKGEDKETVDHLALKTLPSLFEFLINVNEEVSEWKVAFNTINFIVQVLKEAGGTGEISKQRTSGSFKSLNTHAESDTRLSKVDSFGGDLDKGESDNGIEVLSSVTRQFSMRNMAFSASSLFRIMNHFIRSNPVVVEVAYKHLEADVKTVELKRGVGYDPMLRSCLQKLQSSLEAIKSSNKRKDCL